MTPAKTPEKAERLDTFKKQAELAVGVRRGGMAERFTEDQLALIKRQICRPKDRTATDDELELFRYQCERTGLDPFSRQIYAIFRWDGRAKAETMTIQAAIDGLRLIAERTGKYAGQAVPQWCGEDGAWRDTWFSSDPPKAARVIVQKVAGGRIVDTPAVAHYAEYVPRKSNGTIMGLWPTKPAHMLAKCAEALALRKAFPAETSGLYVPEEVEADFIDGDAEEVSAAAAVEAAEPLDQKRVDELIDQIGRRKLKYDDIDLLLGSVGADTLRARSAKAVTERLAALTDAQADEFAKALEVDDA